MIERQRVLILSRIINEQEVPGVTRARVLCRRNTATQQRKQADLLGCILINHPFPLLMTCPWTCMPLPPPACVDCLRDVKAWLWHNVRTPNENKTEMTALEATALWASRPSRTVRNTGVCLDSSLKLEKH